MPANTVEPVGANPLLFKYIISVLVGDWGTYPAGAVPVPLLAWVSVRVVL